LPRSGKGVSFPYIIKMLMYKYSAKNKANSQKLRKNATPQENKLWYQFLRQYRPRFHRQFRIGDYILDFYCHKAKLAIELDGSQHVNDKEKEYDLRRTNYLAGLGIRVMRIPNNKVDRQFDQVCEFIDNYIKSLEKQDDTNDK
jgi:very-short-patch-repair endonuclease